MSGNGAAGGPVNEPIDVVYTWVDDAFPGYMDVLSRYAAKPPDLNPNRTRDNLQMLRYSMRALERYLPWVRNVYLVTCRPQVPEWVNLKAPGLRLIHHDEFFDHPDDLPTFSSFAITVNLHRIPGLSRRFLYVEDDYLFGRPVALDDFLTADGKLKLWRKWEWSPLARRRDKEGSSPWDLAHAQANHLLDGRYGYRPRLMARHLPMLIDIEEWRAVEAMWPEDFRRTTASRFRSRHDIAPDHLYPYALLYESKAALVPLSRSYTQAAYQGIDNIVPQQILQFAFLRRLRPKFICLNDNFGSNPSPFVVALARRFLEDTYPVPSRFELG
jgi:hypothetical protein